MGLTAAGMGSGLDVNGIVTALSEASYSPRQTRFNLQEANAQTEISAIGSLQASLESFQKKLEALQEPDNFRLSKLTTDSDEWLSAEADGDAVAGTYNLVVTQLAQSHKVASAAVVGADDAVGEGQLTIQVGADPDTSLVLDIDAEATLADIATLVNEDEDNPGVSAAVVNSDEGPRLVFTSKDTGTEQEISLSATDSGTSTGLSQAFNSTEEIQAAQDAVVLVDGMTVTSGSNTLDGAIQGLTLELTKADPDEATKITIAQDEDGIKKQVTGFVDAYNSLMGSITSMSGYDSDTGQSGVLQGDSMLRSISNQMRSLVGADYDVGYGNDSTLSQLGISFDQYGKLQVDEELLDDTIANNLPQLTKLFAADETGLAHILDKSIDVYTQTGGLISLREDTLQGQIDRIDEQRTALETAQLAYEQRLYDDFNAMDLVVAQLNSQASTLYGALDSLPGLVSNNDG